VPQSHHDRGVLGDNRVSVQAMTIVVKRISPDAPWLFAPTQTRNPPKRWSSFSVDRTRQERCRGGGMRVQKRIVTLTPNIARSWERFSCPLAKLYTRSTRLIHTRESRSYPLPLIESSGEVRRRWRARPKRTVTPTQSFARWPTTRAPGPAHARISPSCE
jgi:hypothetical protein